MRAEERRDLGRLGGALLRSLTKTVHSIHCAISDATYHQVHRLAGPISRPVQAAQDLVTTGVYAATGAGLDAGARVAGWAAGAASPPDAETLHDRAGRVRLAVAIANGIHGHHVERLGPGVGTRMHLREAGRAVPPTVAGLAAAFAEPRPTIVVFVHGLCEHESIWDPADRPGYPAQLAADLDCTPIRVRYNTGRRISANGATLGSLLAELTEHWPVPVRRLVLIGHSMGGLVIHSALAQAGEAPWAALVSDTVTLGTPHHGAALERVANLVATGADQFAGTRWLAEILASRSDGIHDLRHGNLVAADWTGHHPTDPTDRRTHAPLPDHIRHHAIAGTVARDPDGILAAITGDLLVSVPSAHAVSRPGRPSPYGEGSVAVVGRCTHQDLNHSPVVYPQLLRWLSRPDPGP